MKTFKNKVMSLSLAVGMMAIGLSFSDSNAQELEISMNRDYTGHYEFDGWCAKGGSDCYVVELEPVVIEKV